MEKSASLISSTNCIVKSGLQDSTIRQLAQSEESASLFKSTSMSADDCDVVTYTRKVALLETNLTPPSKDIPLQVLLYLSKEGSVVDEEHITNVQMANNINAKRFIVC